MKTFKVEHRFLQNLIDGSRGIIFRLYDSQDYVSASEVIGIIDRHPDQAPTAWRFVGTGSIEQVIEKRISDIQDNDYPDERIALSRSELLNYLKFLYGPQVEIDTPVRIIYFIFHQTGKNIVVNKPLKSPLYLEAQLYTDGGSRGNPGPSAAAFVLLSTNSTVIAKRGSYLGITTNNQAEYQALKSGLQEALKLEIHILNVYMDSLLVVNQVTGKFKVKNRDLWPIHDTVMTLMRMFKQININHVPRELNKEADKLVNTVLDEASRAQQ